METSIDSLRNASMNSDDSRLVDSILNDLNGPQQQQQQQGPQQQQQQQGPQQGQGQQQQGQQQQGPQQQQMSPEQQKAMLEQRQQQIMMQQQMAVQQQRQQANILKNKNVSILDDIKNESGKLVIILILSVLIHSSLLDSPFNMYPDTFLVPDGTNLNMSAITIKSIILCISFYGIHRVLFS